MTPEAARRIEAELRAADEGPLPVSAAPPPARPFPTFDTIADSAYDSVVPTPPASTPMRFSVNPTRGNLVIGPPPAARISRATYGSVQASAPHLCYDSMDVGDVPAPTMRRLFTDRTGKTEAQAGGSWISGGQFPAPRVFSLEHVAVELQQVRALGACDATIAAGDVARLRAASVLRVQVGYCVYVTSPASLLPFDCHRRRIVIPPQQIFWVDWTFDQSVSLTYMWRCFVRLQGEIGTEMQ
jgi:hypothetical protein